MKLIVDIPDIEYKHIREYYEKNDIVESTYSYIYHGTPLDDIRKEITKYIDQNPKNDNQRHRNGAYFNCLDIID